MFENTNLTQELARVKVLSTPLSYAEHRIDLLRTVLDRIAHCEQDCSDKDAIYFMREIAKEGLEADDFRNKSKTNKTMTKNEAIIKASSHYLTKDLPENFDEMEEDGIFDFIKSNVWQPFENLDEASIASCIEELADDILEAYNEGVKNCLISQKNALQSFINDHNKNNEQHI